MRPNRDDRTEGLALKLQLLLVVGIGMVVGSLLSGLLTTPASLYAQSTSPLTIQPDTGRVGIGTTAPEHKLDVAGTIRSSSGGFVFPNGTVQTTAPGPYAPGEASLGQMSDCTLAQQCMDDSLGVYKKRVEQKVHNSGTLRVQYRIRNRIGVTTSYPCYGRLYVNDVAVGPERVVWSPFGDQTYNDDIAVNISDRIAVYTHEYCELTSMVLKADRSTYVKYLVQGGLVP